MEFVDNTGHIFSLPSYKELPIGYEYDEYSYIFWINSNNTSKLSVNNYYSTPIYALYELNKSFNINDFSDDINPVLDIEIYVKESNVFKLISSKNLQESLLKDGYSFTDYIDLNMFEKNSDNEYNEKFNFIKTKLTNKDLYCIKTNETKYANEKDIIGTTINYLMIPIYPIAMSTEAGTWITNLMIHIHNNSNDNDEWCYISIGGEFVSEYEELIINGKNMGISLPKDIMKSVYEESLYNYQFNEALFNTKMKEYLLNYMNIKGEIGNFRSAIDSLKWFGYGDRLTISKLLKTDNEFKEQYILDYFDISYDILESFKTFLSNALVSLRIMINKETDEQYVFDNDLSTSECIIQEKQYSVLFGTYGGFLGENKPKMLSLLDNYVKVKIGNHDMPIEDDDEKYWYWKPYFNFSFNELGVKLICLAYYYKKYFLPLHIGIHNASLGYRVFANDIKLTNKVGCAINYPSIVLNNKNEVIFKGDGIHYFTKQVHYIDEYFNEYENIPNIGEDPRDWYIINDTCVNIPIEFISNDINQGYFNCVLLLQKASNNETIYESHFAFNQSNIQIYKNFIIYPKKFNTKITFKDGDVKRETRYIEYWINNDFIIKLLVNNKWYEYDFRLKIHQPQIDFGTLQYRYYFNDHNYLFGKILSNNNGKIHNIILCDSSDINNIENNLYIENFIDDEFGITPLDLSPSALQNILNIPSNYNAKIINDNLFGDDEYIINWTTNEESQNSKFYVLYKFDFNESVDIDDTQSFYKYSYVTFCRTPNKNTNTVVIYPDSWDTPIFIKNTLKSINQKLYGYEGYNLDESKSYIESFNIDETEELFQFFKSNYNILSPFKQLNYINDDTKSISFNAYMHNKQLVDMNDINFDINIYDILHYHLNHNLMYVDGTLVDNMFYKFIKYYENEKEYEIYIHSDLIGKPITFAINSEQSNKILICAYNNEIYMLQECEEFDNENNYIIINVNALNHNEIPFVLSEDGSDYLIYDTFKLEYDASRNAYVKKINDTYIYYPLYDKLYSNIDRINSKYISTVNLPNNMKYKNSIHLFGIYKTDITERNILIFHDDIDMYIDGINFKHSKNRNNTDEELKIYIKGTLKTDIDSRYPDIYGLYWSNPFKNGKLPLLPTEISSLIDRLGLFVQRDYSELYEPIDNAKPMWELNNIFRYDINEFRYYTESNDTCIGSITYYSLDDFYNNVPLEYNLYDYYNDIDIFIKDNKYCFIDKEIKDLDNIKQYKINELHYVIDFLNEENNIIQVSLNEIDNKEYSKVKVTFFYNKSYIVRNRFYMIGDYIQLLNDEGNTVTYNISNENGKYYINMNINGILYIAELVEFRKKFKYIDNMYNNIVSNQNPSMYWYNIDNGKFESLSSYLNKLERYVYDGSNDIEELKKKLDNYVYEHTNHIRYTDDNDSAKYIYSTYLVKDLTGISGTFKTDLITSFNNYDNILRICVEIIDENDNIIIHDKIGESFDLSGKEHQVRIYLQFISDFYVRFKTDDIWFIPKLMKTIITESRLPYIPSESGKNIVKVNYLNKEFEFGDNHSDIENSNIYDLYNYFFKLKFNIYDSYIDGRDLKTERIHSVYDYINDVKLDTYLNYDFYLMHDHDYWYALYISQETCNKIQNNDDLKIKDKDKYKMTYDKNYILKYERSSEEYLLNRLEYNSSNGINQFNNDDIIACYIYNNDRLPFNAGISSKWHITPLSLGISESKSYNTNGEMNIISLPQNDNKYERGYYKVTIRYSLDRDIQHQFKETTTIKIS